MKGILNPNPFHAGFTGTRIGMSANQATQCHDMLLELYNRGYRTFHHGDAIGSDADADAIARDIGYHICIHPPTNPKCRAYCNHSWDDLRDEYDYGIRDHHIVNESSILLAAPKDENREEWRGSGTWLTIRYARKIGRPYHILKR